MGRGAVGAGVEAALVSIWLRMMLRRSHDEIERRG